MDNFDLKKFLIENKLTANSKLLDQQLSESSQEQLDELDLRRAALNAAAGLAMLGGTTATGQTKVSTQSAPTQTSITAQNQKTTNQITATSLNIDQTFPSGEAEIVDIKEIEAGISKLQNWISNNKTKPFKIVITASESQVPVNKPDSPYYKKPKALAQARANAILPYLNKLKAQDIQINTELGKTAWNPKKGADHPDYTREQFVRVDIIVDAQSVCSMQPIKGKGKQGDMGKDYVTATEYLSGKGELEMNSGTIPDRMVVVDVNGNITHDTGYVATSEKSGNWKYTPAYVLALTKARNSPAMANTKLEVTKPLKGNTVEEKYNDLISQLANIPNPQLAGKEIGPALLEMKKMIANNITEFVLYKIQKNTPVKLDFDGSKGDVQMKVYSPVGNTGYDIKGICTGI